MSRTDKCRQKRGLGKHQVFLGGGIIYTRVVRSRGTGQNLEATLLAFPLA
jgi:hypothetical protein